MNKRKGIFLFAALLITAISVVLAAGQTKLLINGVVASTRVVMLNGEAYVPVKDVAQALDMQVTKSADEYELSRNGGGTPQAQAMQSAPPEDTLPLTNIPAKASHDLGNNLVVVNNEKANVLNAPPTQWLPLTDPKAQGIASDWTAPMTIGGQTYGNGYMFLFYGSPGDNQTLTYWLKGRHYSTLTAMLGFDDHVQGDTASTFEVSFLGNGKLLKSVQLSSSNNPASVQVPVSGVLTLKINVKLSAQGSGYYPVLDLVNPTLSR